MLRDTIEPNSIVTNLINSIKDFRELAGIPEVFSDASSSSCSKSSTDDEDDSLTLVNLQEDHNSSAEENLDRFNFLDEFEMRACVEMEVVTRAELEVVAPIESEVNASDDMTSVDVAFKLMNFNNSKIARAKLFNENDNVIFNKQLKIYNVIHEKKKVFQIQLLPKTSCTCLEKVICCHILAVQYFNGAEIDKRFNLPSLSQVILANNDQQKTGRKMRGHEKNSKPTRLLNEEEVITEPESDGAVPEEEQMFKSLPFLKQFYEKVKINSF